MRKNNFYLEVYLGPLKKPWEDYCLQMGKKSGSAIREAIAAQLANLPKGQTIAQPVCGQAAGLPDQEAKARIEIRLTQSEKAQLEILATHENCSLQTWIINVVRTMLTKQPQCGMREMEILGESNYQLLSIGRNLNQMTKRINQGYVQPITLEHIEQLQHQINRHTELVSQALRASVERWSLQ